MTEGVIGVYDRTETQHLNSMAHDAAKFTEDDTPDVSPFSD